MIEWSKILFVLLVINPRAVTREKNSLRAHAQEQQEESQREHPTAGSFPSFLAAADGQLLIIEQRQ